MSDPSHNATIIFKIATVAQWHNAESDVFMGSPDDERDGFIHLSQAHQLPDTLTKHYSGRNENRHGDLVLAAYSATDLGANLRWEKSRGGALFPHLYASLDKRKALWVARLMRDEAGNAILPEGIA
jgi:uncharacterized protein (DUF952 family)